MNAKFSGFVICVEAIIYLLLSFILLLLFMIMICYLLFAQLLLLNDLIFLIKDTLKDRKVMRCSKQNVEQVSSFILDLHLCSFIGCLMDVLLSLIKEINRLIRLKVTTEKNLTFSILQLFKFKKFVSRPVFGQLQLTQMSLNFKTSSCNLKIRGLEKKARVDFLLFRF